MTIKKSKPDYILDAFEKTSPELIKDIASTIELIAIEQYSLDERQAKELSIDVSISLAKQWGGQQIYIPTSINLQNIDRDYKIYQDFNGFNHNELAKKYGCSHMTIYKVIKKFKEL